MSLASLENVVVIHYNKDSDSSSCAMTKHYILSVDPTAKYDWDRCTLRDPITANRPDLAELIAEAVGETAGSYLIAVNIEVQVLEQTAPTAQTKRLPPSDLDATVRSQRVQLEELAA